MGVLNFVPGLMRESYSESGSLGVELLTTDLIMERYPSWISSGRLVLNERELDALVYYVRYGAEYLLLSESVKDTLRLMFLRRSDVKGLWLLNLALRDDVDGWGYFERLVAPFLEDAEMMGQGALNRFRAYMEMWDDVIAQQHLMVDFDAFEDYDSNVRSLTSLPVHLRDFVDGVGPLVGSVNDPIRFYASLQLLMRLATVAI